MDKIDSETYRQLQRCKSLLLHTALDEHGCLIWQGYMGNRGYGIAWLNGKKSSLVHRFVAYYCLPLTDYQEKHFDSLFVCHKCDTRLCINPKHLFLGTALDNVTDAVSKGRHIHGEMQGRHKLTEKEVLEIKDIVTNRRYISLRRLAKQYGVTHATISLIMSGQRWSYLNNNSTE